MTHFRRQPLSLDHYLYMSFQPETLESFPEMAVMVFLIDYRAGRWSTTQQKIFFIMLLFLLCFTRLINIYQDKWGNSGLREMRMGALNKSFNAMIKNMTLNAWVADRGALVSFDLKTFALFLLRCGLFLIYVRGLFLIYVRGFSFFIFIRPYSSLPCLPFTMPVKKI